MLDLLCLCLTTQNCTRRAAFFLSEPCNTSEAFPEPVCGQISQMLDRCFHNTTPNIGLEPLYAVQIPETVEQIHRRCLLFNRGMECVQRYLDVCVDSKQRLIIGNEVYGAKRLYEFLCRDGSFQQEFLWHKDCFQLVHQDLDVCSKRFVSILKDEMTKTTEQTFNQQYMHFCCARYAYENCVYTSARYKCKPDSAVFLRRIAKLLSTDKHFLNCDKIETEVCSSASRTFVAAVEWWWSIVVLLLLLVVTAQA
uniref:DUF19 domain-containing protein n=1 Tax=Anopheles epiroticus TaxID=199890 RepID=A0A182P3U5_9DIPT